MWTLFYLGMTKQCATFRQVLHAVDMTKQCATCRQVLHAVDMTKQCVTCRHVLHAVVKAANEQRVIQQGIGDIM